MQQGADNHAQLGKEQFLLSRDTLAGNEPLSQVHTQHADGSYNLEEFENSEFLGIEEERTMYLFLPVDLVSLRFLDTFTSIGGSLCTRLSHELAESWAACT